METREFCFVCGASSDEVGMTETEDGFICIDCTGEIEYLDEDVEEQPAENETDDANGLKII